MVKKYSITKTWQSPPRAHKPKDGCADFETAISATGFGKYNLLLVLMAVPSCWASIFETTTMSYVFPAAQCDLDLSLADKGLLNATTYLGMISSAVIWGFLCDTLGRKKLLCVGFLLDACLVLLSGLSQTKSFLLATKFLGGFIINGPFAALASYVSEFHSAKYRATMQLVLGCIFNFGSIVLPLLAWMVLPQNWSFKTFGIELHSWNIYLFLTSTASFSSFAVFVFMPESPKFLMTTGRNDKALKVLQTVYSINSGKPESSYPIKELLDEIKGQAHLKHGGKVTANRSKMQALSEGWQQMRPLFFPPHLMNLILVCVMQMLFTMSLNTLRLWLPQIFQAINDYKFYNNGTTAALCDMLDIIQPSTSEKECFVNFENNSVYISSIIVASIAMCSYLLAGFLINILGKKKLITILGFMAGTAAFTIHQTRTAPGTLLTASLFIASASISTNVILTVTIDLFPTTLRTMTVSLSMMMARTGAMSGNLLFPILLQIGCASPFFLVGSTIIFCAFLAFLLPNTEMKALE